MGKEEILRVDDLQTHFFIEEGKVAKAVDGVSFTIHAGETLALVGESGSGKSMTAHSIMRLINKPGEIVNGTIHINGENLLEKPERDMRNIRGNEIAMIFQEPMTALNPVFSIGNQIVEMIRKHKKVSKKAAEEKAVELLHIVGIPRAKEIMHEYPHQLSGGMRQRVMIAMAISCEPKLLIADEPTTALDVTIQLQILDLLKEMQEKMNMAILLITHDLGVVSHFADRTAVMYGGQIVEQAPTKEILKTFKHPYTKGLINSMPSLNDTSSRLEAIEGTVAPAYDFPKGCRFSARCPYVMDACKEENPRLRSIDKDHEVRCLLYKEGESQIHGSRREYRETAEPRQ